MCLIQKYDNLTLIKPKIRVFLTNKMMYSGNNMYFCIQIIKQYKNY